MHVWGETLETKWRRGYENIPVNIITVSYTWEPTIFWGKPVHVSPSPFHRFTAFHLCSPHHPFLPTVVCKWSRITDRVTIRSLRDLRRPIHDSSGEVTPTFWALGTGFLNSYFSMIRSGGLFGMIQAHYIIVHFISNLTPPLEELKSLLMKVKEGEWIVGLKLNIQKTKIMVSRPFTSWQTDGETVEIVADFIFLGSKNHYRWWLQPWN